MKNTIVILVFFVTGAALYAADVDFTLTDNTDGTVTLTYVVNAGDPPIAMALDVDASVPVVAVTGWDSFFDFFIDAAYTMESVTPGSYNYGDGTPIAHQHEAGEAILPLASFCLSMAGLGGAATPLNEPPDGVTPVVVGIINLGGPGLLTISENVLRGGVYGYNGRLSTNLPKFAIPPYCCECVKDTAPFYDEWVGEGKPWDKPDCWCYERQCRGNTDGIKEGYQISQTDLLTFLAAFNKADFKLDQTKICADFDHMKSGYRVSQADLLIFLSYFSKADFKIPVCSLDWEDIDGFGPGVGDGDEDYNFWIVP